MPGIESGRWPDTGAGSPYLTAAFQVADQLMLSAVPVGSGIGWEGDTLGDEAAGGHTIVRQPIGPDLYGGSAGIAWFLAQVARFDSSGDAAVMAGRAMHAALASADLPPHVNDPSLFSGAGGTALAAVRVGMQIEDRTLQARALAIAERIADMVAKAPDQWPSDVISGLAGTVIALLAIARQSRRSDFAGEACRAACNELIRRASKEWWGWSWPEAGGRADAPALCGLAHGASGVGWALAEAGWALGEPEFVAAAGEAFHYERSWFASDRCAWPDLREPDDQGALKGTWPGWTTAWCHGALGIGAVRLRFHQVTRDSSALADATAAIHGARLLVAGSGAALRRREIGDPSLCHGLAGAAELFLLAQATLGSDDHGRAARRVGDLCLELQQANSGRWPCGLRGARDVPGLFLGLAGIGMTMLRLHDPGLSDSPALISGLAPLAPPASNPGLA